jgi:hypothetical protein
MEWKFTVLWNQNQVAWIERQRLNPSWQLEFEIKNLNWNHRCNWNQASWIILASDSTTLENIPMEWVHRPTWNIALSDGACAHVWNEDKNEGINGRWLNKQQKIAHMRTT